MSTIKLNDMISTKNLQQNLIKPFQQKSKFTGLRFSVCTLIQHSIYKIIGLKFNITL